MKKLGIIGGIIAICASCAPTKNVKDNPELAADYAKSITAEDLKNHLYKFASDEFEGREAGEQGQKLAAEYLKSAYQSYGLKAPFKNNNYFQKFDSTYVHAGIRAKGRKIRKTFKPSENVIAFIEGSEFPNEYVIVSSHYDHIGIKNGEINNGADDDGSGTVSVLEIAQAFSQAAKKGHTPRRSVVFMNFTAEEKGLWGSKYYSDNPVFPLENTVTDLNIDMVGRIDPLHVDTKNPNYIYVIGSDHLSTDLHNVNEAANKEFVNLNLDYKYNATDHPKRFYYRSDHYNFAKHGIPVIFFFNGTHADYHKPTDTPEKINYEVLEQRTKLFFHTAWKIANRNNKLVVDKL